jgi:glycosyltransferase involved in cell wall biosynthesis
VTPSGDGAGEAAMRPRFSLVVPAFDEERLLPDLLDSVDAARRAYSGGADSIEVVVADNASTDRTAEVAAARGCRVVGVERRMIAAARNGGAREARGEVLGFIDADSRIHPDTFTVIDELLASGRYVGGATGIRPERWSPGIAATWFVLSPIAWALRLDAGVVFCRRHDFETVGGYPEDRLFAEDVAFLMRLRNLGRRRGQTLARNTRAKAVTSARKFDEHGDWHYFRVIAQAGPLLFRPSALAPRWVTAYWYNRRR